MSNEKLLQLIFDAVDEINPQLPEDQQLAKSINTALYGESGKLDSLGLVNFIVAIERRIDEELGVTITIADERAISQKNSPFRTISTLTDYVIQLLKEDT